MDLANFLNHRVYFDSNLFIYLVERIQPYAAILEKFVQAAEDEKITIVTSDLTLSEVLVKPIENNNLIQEQVFLSVLRYAPRLERLLISEEILINAAKIRANQSIKLPDAIHIATANQAACHYFLTNDKKIADVTNCKFKCVLISNL